MRKENFKNENGILKKKNGEFSSLYDLLQNYEELK